MKKNPGVFVGCEKGTKGYFWVYAKKSSDFFGYTDSEDMIFWGIKYEPLLDTPPLKFVSGALGPLEVESLICVSQKTKFGAGFLSTFKMYYLEPRSTTSENGHIFG